MATTARAREFFSPLPLFAVVLLVLNDHVFKAAFHNALTGKVSDFAGCFFLPLFVSALLSYVPRLGDEVKLRVLIGCVATLGLFVPIKLSAAAGLLVCAVLQHVSIPLGIGALHIVADPTDLFAVPMVALSALYAWKVTR
ncbi:MAG: hypothetical protein JNM17_36300 [Archangium sp.]|nr:hypothetical protein [Archangium sp.]